MTINQIKFIKDHKNLIDSNDFDTLYEEASQQLNEDSSWLTNILLESDVDFLHYMSYIPTRCFLGLPITGITIPACIEYINFRAFQDCANLKSLNFDEGSKCKKIESRAFLGCQQLSIIELPESVEEINCENFSDCTQLQIFSFSLNLWCCGAINPFPYPKNVIIRDIPKPGKEAYYNYLTKFIMGGRKC